MRHWPQQPLDAAVEWVGHLDSSAVVADFGCGHAQLAARVPHRVISLDLVAAVPGVLACDMAHTPLGRIPWLADLLGPHACTFHVPAGKGGVQRLLVCMHYAAGFVRGTCSIIIWDGTRTTSVAGGKTV